MRINASRLWRNIPLIIGLVTVVAVAVVGIHFVAAEPGAQESEKFVCNMRTSVDEPLLDPATSNDRAELAASLRKRARIFKNAADRTGGDVRRAMQNYSDAIRKIAGAIEGDTSGASLAEAISALATDPAIAASDRTLKDILDNRC